MSGGNVRHVSTTTVTHCKMLRCNDVICIYDDTTYTVSIIENVFMFLYIFLPGEHVAILAKRCSEYSTNWRRPKSRAACCRYYAYNAYNTHLVVNAILSVAHYMAPQANSSACSILDMVVADYRPVPSACDACCSRHARCTFFGISRMAHSVFDKFTLKYYTVVVVSR